MFYMITTTFTGVCEKGWARFNNRCYILMEQSKTFSEARESCRESGATLVTIASDDENNLVYSL